MLTKDTILFDLVEKHPKTEEYFRSINDERCILCYNLFDSLETIAEEFDLELEEFIEEIKCQY